MLEVSMLDLKLFECLRLLFLLVVLLHGGMLVILLLGDHCVLVFPCRLLEIRITVRDILCGIAYLVKRRPVRLTFKINVSIIVKARRKRSRRSHVWADRNGTQRTRRKLSQRFTMVKLRKLNIAIITTVVISYNRVVPYLLFNIYSR
jgi:hypothetical protein